MENDQNPGEKEVSGGDSGKAVAPKAPVTKPKPINRKPLNKSERSQNTSPQLSISNLHI